MTQHTQGPWRIDPCWDILGNTTSGNGLVCDVSHGDFFSDGEAEANARLIAAAPDLLEALKNALPAIKSCADEYPHGEWPSMYEQAKNAIAKAKGETK